jgi:hypothetical protein
MTMQSKLENLTEKVREEVETMPEIADVAFEIPPTPRSKEEELLDEALMESFPASDPMASGRME